MKLEYTLMYTGGFFINSTTTSLLHDNSGYSLANIARGL